jgi:hypothetical protein
MKKPELKQVIKEVIQEPTKISKEEIFLYKLSKTKKVFEEVISELKLLMTHEK